VSQGRAAINLLIILVSLGIIGALIMPATFSAMQKTTDVLGGMAPEEMASRGFEDDWDLSVKSEGEKPNFLPDPSIAKPTKEREEQAQKPRLRSWFPETLLWRPELITNAQGHARLEMDLADSITNWKMSSSAVSLNGAMGQLTTDITVFQPFFVDVNLPVALTRGDEISLPVVIHNYLKEEQKVSITLEKSDWFTLHDDSKKTITLKANDVAALYFRMKVNKVGFKKLRLTALGNNVGDAIEKRIEIIPDGRLVENVFNGSLDNDKDFEIEISDDAIEGSIKGQLKIYPGSFSQLVEGLDGVFQMPHGCFEQTSTTTYPNVMALAYLRQHNKSLPEVEAKATNYIHLGYQRLVSFEVDGGGFDWYGNPPANKTLTAYGLMEFEDMAKVHDVDADLIDRTRAWLMQQQNSDGSWTSDRGGLDKLVGVYGDAKLKNSAYIAWSVFQNQPQATGANKALNYLLSHDANNISDPHLLALMSNAIAAIDPNKAHAYLDRLDTLRNESDDGRMIWWQPSNMNSRGLFHSQGLSNQIEITALTVLAKIKAKHQMQDVRKALRYLVSEKDSRGTWHSTQATILALKALIKGSASSMSNGKARHIQVLVNDEIKKEIRIAANQSEVMAMVDLKSLLTSNKQKITLKDLTQGEAIYQLVVRHHRPDAEKRQERDFGIHLAYSKNKVKKGEEIKVTSTLRNHGKSAAPMVMVSLPIPAGCQIEREDFENMKNKKLIGKYEVNAREVTLYLRDLKSDAPFIFNYSLRPTLSEKITVPSAKIYEYYNPAKSAESETLQLTVS